MLLIHDINITRWCALLVLEHHHVLEFNVFVRILPANLSVCSDNVFTFYWIFFCKTRCFFRHSYYTEWYVTSIRYFSKLATNQSKSMHVFAQRKGKKKFIRKTCCFPAPYHQNCGYSEWYRMHILGSSNWIDYGSLNSHFSQICTKNSLSVNHSRLLTVSQSKCPNWCDWSLNSVNMEKCVTLPRSL